MKELQQEIREAAATQRRLRIRGGGSKDFYGGELQGEVLDTRPLVGIVDYEPTELVITAKAGTLLTDIERALAEHSQLLAFEPPTFGGHATLGGAVASGLSGPRRPYCGALRHFVLGVRMLDGRGDDLRFGGRVIKNVAGFDVSRFMAGTMGTLGVITEVTLKTLPRPPAECTLSFELSEADALLCSNQWAGRPLPLSGTAWHAGRLLARLSGATAAVRAARQSLGGDIVQHAEEFWNGLREQRLPFFCAAAELWRISLPPSSPPLNVRSAASVISPDPGSAPVSSSARDEQRPMLIEWGGGLRWVPGPVDGADLRTVTERLGGHVTLYRAVVKPPEGVFQPLPKALASLHQRLKAAFDPQGIFNHGRLYPSL